MPNSEALDRIARSGEAVFALDSSDRIILWNKKCEDLLGRPARAAGRVSGWEATCAAG